MKHLNDKTSHNSMSSGKRSENHEEHSDIYPYIYRAIFTPYLYRGGGANFPPPLSKK